MIHTFELMLYVDDVEKVADFWVKVIGVKENGRAEMPDGSLRIGLDVADHIKLCLFNKEFIRRFSDVPIAMPSIMLHTDELEVLRKRILDAGCFANEISEREGTRFFNFADPERNYYAVSEVK